MHTHVRVNPTQVVLRLQKCSLETIAFDTGSFALNVAVSSSQQMVRTQRV